MEKLSPESRTREYKETIKKDFNKVAKTVVAFANDIGGEIWIGVNNQRVITGLDDTVIESHLEDLPKSLFDAIQPMVPCELIQKNINNKCVLILRIFSGPQKPYYLKSEGLPKGIYVRVGSSVMRAKEIHLQELSLTQHHHHFDETIIAGLALNDLDQKILQQCYPTFSQNAMEHDGILRRDFLSKKLQVTIAAVLMFHPQPHIFVPEATIQFCIYKWGNATKPHKTREITGPIPNLLEECLEELKPFLAESYRLKKAKLSPTKWEIPQRALREALANALLHRKYNIPASVRVSLFGDKLEIYSPGNFPGPIDLKQLGDGTSYIRNIHICRVARKLDLIEKRGTGIRLILDEIKTAGLKTPAFIEGADFIKLNFFNEKSLQKNNHNDPWAHMLELLESEKSITSTQLAARLEVSKVTALKLVKQWTDQGLVIKKGRGPSSRYELI